VTGAVIVTALIVFQSLKYGKINLDGDSLKKPRLLLSLIGGVFVVALVLFVVIRILKEV